MRLESLSSFRQAKEMLDQKPAALVDEDAFDQVPLRRTYPFRIVFNFLILRLVKLRLKTQLSKL